MIKPNWNIFKAKFNDNPQEYFEWFCYLLFCAEFDKPVGVFRYKNQSAIETCPITYDEEVIGWQAKFYETKLAENKTELLAMLDKAKRDYPELNKIILYTNQEWGQGKAQGSAQEKKNNNDPKPKQEIDKKAQEYGIELVWRTASYFESPLVSNTNQELAKHFFSEQNSIIDLLNKRRRLSENILYAIKTSISLPGAKIEIDRGQTLELLRRKLEKNSIVIVHGAGGVGKTALIKNLYEQEVENRPIYVFKASEFSSNNGEDLFEGFGVEGFIAAHTGEYKETVIIDSAEKLADVDNLDSFKNLLTTLIKSKWKIIFTTRDIYLSDLESDLLDCYEVLFDKISLKNLTTTELIKIAEDSDFCLPVDENLLELIKNPFYLNEYLRFSKDQTQNYVKFKSDLWRKRISKNKPEREQAFLSLAFQRANEGQFFITPNQDSIVLKQLAADGILGYETAGYFITHDIYEEWALEKKVDTAFKRKRNNDDFLKEIGDSLPMRRSFRSWVSERLLIGDQGIDRFCLDALQDENIPFFWRDEIWISILLSDNSSEFICQLKNDLLRNDLSLLRRLTFLLRLACKEVNYDTLKNIGIDRFELLNTEYILTRPKGSGWCSVIQFVYANLDDINIENVSFLLPMLNEWNKNYNEGETTRLASLIALKYYQWIIEKKGYISREGNSSQLLQTITQGGSSICNELKEIFNNILSNKLTRGGDPYFDLAKLVLTDIYALPIWKTMPKKVMELASLFWLESNENTARHYSGMDWEKDFGLNENFKEYFPASAFQTPVYFLLKIELKATLDFIIDFTNQSVGSFYKSAKDSSIIEEVDVILSNDLIVKQYICNRLWCAYRGTEVGPDVFYSIHMALEKCFLELASNAEAETLEIYLFYLLKNSRSASITAVVASIVKAYPDKTFNIACILFKTKEFFIYDTNRFVYDLTHKNQLILLRDNFGGPVLRNSIHENERLDACDKKHHKLSLEQLAINCQLFRNSDVSEIIFKERQDKIWEILDGFYENLPDKILEKDADRTWRLFLARMDRRKMEVISDIKEDSIQLTLNPQLDPELKIYSEQAVQENNERFKYTPLNLWATFKKDHDERHKQYPQYNESPYLALDEVKEILNKLHADADNDFVLLNKDIPAKACSVLLSEHLEQLTPDDRNYCKEIIHDYCSIFLSPNYRYQVSDGADFIYLLGLPAIFNVYPDDRETLSVILFFTLLNESNIDALGSQFGFFAIHCMHNLWQDFPSEMESILAGYLQLKPHFDELLRSNLTENHTKGIYTVSQEALFEDFTNQHEDKLILLSKGMLKLSDTQFDKIVDAGVLGVAFSILPTPTLNSEQKSLASYIVEFFARKLLINSRKSEIDYTLRNSFLEKLSYLLLSSSRDDIKVYLSSFLDKFNNSESIAELFNKIISAEDHLGTHGKFWYIWELFFDKVLAICLNHKRQNLYNDKVIKSYLFTTQYWKKECKSWRSFKVTDKLFFKKITSNAGHSPSVLYSMAFLLDGIAHHYLDDGISWVSAQLQNNKNLWEIELEQNTTYYLERIVRAFSFKERERIRKTNQLKQELLVILNFLVEQGSVTGYMVRERIL